MTEKRTHDYVRHGTTNLFAALNVTTGEVFGQCTPTRDGADFLAFLRQAVTPHAGKDIHVVLDNLSTHKTPEVRAWLAQNPQVSFHFTPIGSSWINQIEIWFGIITRQSVAPSAGLPSPGCPEHDLALASPPHAHGPHRPDGASDGRRPRCVGGADGAGEPGDLDRPPDACLLISGAVSTIPLNAVFSGIRRTARQRSIRVAAHV